jgi:hypothetical protein
MQALSSGTINLDSLDPQ